MVVHPLAAGRTVCAMLVAMSFGGRGVLFSRAQFPAVTTTTTGEEYTWGGQEELIKQLTSSYDVLYIVVPLRMFDQR